MARWFRRSRSSGDPEISPQLSVEVVGPVTPEFIFALRLKAADGDEAAGITLAQVLRQADVQELTANAEAGDVENAYLLALALQAQGSKKDAMRWLRTAAEGGAPDAAYDMAVQTLGAKVGRNLGKAEPWLRLAADAGHGPAAAMLGMTLGQSGRNHWREAERYHWIQRPSRSAWTAWGMDLWRPPTSWSQIGPATTT